MYISLPPKRMANPDDPSDPARLLRKRIPIGLKLQPYFEMAEYPVSKEMKALTEDDEKAPAPVSGKKRQAEVRPTKNTRGNEQGPVRALPVLKDSALAYFVNGQCQGVAFRDIYDYLQLRETPKRQAARDKQSLNLKERHNPFDDGTLGYYPMISLYHDAVVKVNAGPDFAFPPPPDIDNLLEAGDGQAPKRTWRPLCERYEEFVTEMFALDDMEEESARTKLLEKPPEPDPISEERASQLAKRRKRDQARREAKRAETTGSRSGAAGTPSSRTESRAVSVSHRAQSGTPQPTLPRSGGTPASISIPKQLESSPAPSSIDHNFTAGGGQYLEPERDMGGHSSGVSRHQSISAEELRDSPPVKLEELNTSAMPSPSPVEQDLEMETEG
jgi:COMPASS component BRE2